jgi:hypothetical protein
MRDGSVVCSAIAYWFELCRTHNRILLAHLRLLQPGGLGPHIYKPQLYPRAVDYHFIAFYKCQELRWRYSNLLSQRDVAELKHKPSSCSAVKIISACLKFFSHPGGHPVLPIRTVKTQDASRISKPRGQEIK